VEHEVRRRGGPADRHAIAVDHEAVRDDVDVGVGGREILEILPVDGGAVAVEQAGAGQDPGRGVDAADQRKAGRDASEVADQRAGRDLGEAVAGDDDERLGPDGVGERAGGGQGDPQVSGTGAPSGETTRQR
jgi:hypothetical protein